MTTVVARDRRDDTASASIAALVPRAQREISAAGPGPVTDCLLTLLRGPLVRYCLARIDPGRAEDIAQETCAAVFEALPRYRPTRADRPFRAFVYGIAAHKVADFHRVHARSAAREQLVRDVPDTVADERLPEEVVLAAERRAELNQLLSGLSPAHRTLLVLCVAEERSSVEAARILGSTPQAVRVRKRRALAALRAHAARTTATPPRGLPADGGRGGTDRAVVPCRDRARLAVRR
ncbi:sigma-70 family RNA polymerase sigma factor [Amycolatopsis sp. WGS_07]|uniref:sigma-70 family RNA polymerase sigma factor n=1 Tax=Amycolatopsis sp. WGS_07 TaxID=3076764 RepID=UPI003872AB82